MPTLAIEWHVATHSRIRMPAGFAMCRDDPTSAQLTFEIFAGCRETDHLRDRACRADQNTCHLHWVEHEEQVAQLFYTATDHSVMGGSVLRTAAHERITPTPWGSAVGILLRGGNAYEVAASEALTIANRATRPGPARPLVVGHIGNHTRSPLCLWPGAVSAPRAALPRISRPLAARSQRNYR